MIKTYNFSDNSTALPLTKAQRVLRSLGDTDSYSPHFFDDGFPKEILHTDAQAVLNVLDDIVFEREELRAKLAALESQPAVAYVRFSNGEVDYDADAVISNTPGDCMDESIEWFPVYAAAGAAPVQAGWISVKDKMPDSGLTVLACYKNSGQLIRRVRAMWVAAKSVESGCDSYIGEYDEESDTYYDPEGWYEKIDNWEEFTALMIDHPVTHWMPLPSAPKEQTP